MMVYHRRQFLDYSAGVLNDLLHALAAEAGSPVRVTAAFGDVPTDAVDIHFLAGNEVQFRVRGEYPSQERREFFTNRWVCSWQFFAEMKRMAPALTGSCRLWLDDHPSGPGLAFCGNTVNNILIPDSVFLETGSYQSLRDFMRENAWPWYFRQDMVFWRGASTGQRGAPGFKTWRDLPRVRLCQLVQRLERACMFDVGLSQLAQIWDPGELAEAAAAGIMRPEVATTEFARYRHSIDIDGNTCSWPGLFTKMIMGMTIIKVASPLGFRQWYYDRLQPWKNFVPLSGDMAELAELAEWLLTHPEEAASIGAGAAALAADLTTDKVFAEMVPRIQAAVT